MYNFQDKSKHLCMTNKTLPNLVLFITSPHLQQGTLYFIPLFLLSWANRSFPNIPWHFMACCLGHKTSMLIIPLSYPAFSPTLVDSKYLFFKFQIKLYFYFKPTFLCTLIYLSLYFSSSYAEWLFFVVYMLVSSSNNLKGETLQYCFNFNYAKKPFLIFYTGLPVPSPTPMSHERIISNYLFIFHIGLETPHRPGRRWHRVTEKALDKSKFNCSQ